MPDRTVEADGMSRPVARGKLALQLAGEPLMRALLAAVTLASCAPAAAQNPLSAVGKRALKPRHYALAWPLGCSQAGMPLSTYSERTI